MRCGTWQTPVKETKETYEVLKIILKKLEIIRMKMKYQSDVE